jgi:hypothetical protein
LFHRPTGAVPAAGDTVTFGLDEIDAAVSAAEELATISKQMITANHNAVTSRRLVCGAESGVPTVKIPSVHSAC